MSNEDPAFGIKKIEIYRPGTGVSLQSCTAQESGSKLVNRFKIEEVEYINIAFKVPYEIADDYMESEYAHSIITIRTFLERISSFQMMMDRATKIREVISAMTLKV